MKIIGRKKEQRIRPKLTDKQKAKIKERLAQRAKGQKNSISREELLKKENVIEITKEVKIELEDQDLFLEAGDIVEVIPAKK